MRGRGSEFSAFSLFTFQDIITSVTGIMILASLILALEFVERKTEAPAQQTKNIIQQMRNAIEHNRRLTQDMHLQFERDRVALDEYSQIDASKVDEELKDIREAITRKTAEASKIEKKLTQVNWEAAKLSKELAQINDVELDKAKSELELRRQELESLRASNRIILNARTGTSKPCWLLELDGTRVRAALVGRPMQPLEFASQSKLFEWAKTRDNHEEAFVLIVKPTAVTTYDEILDTLHKKLLFDVGLDLLGGDQTVFDPVSGAVE